LKYMQVGPDIKKKKKERETSLHFDF